ncbi:flippase [Methanosarcina sp. WWM596]|uniref:flippase n=1 Tax=Methanosarcina sp. WWM596 TaxID=1434103 RepID=UPI0006155409|nr:flippase [Methanosarcina sp. WWM596]AKB17615.1 hypothetical protein MSWHS_0752 [Methanosarcina sp. WWM596]
MSLARDVAKNTSFILFGNIVVKLIALFVSVYLARYLGVNNYGKYTFVTTYLMFFTFISGFGLDQVIIREIARNPSTTNVVFNNAFYIRIVTSIVAVLLAVAGIRILNYPYDTVIYVYLVSITLLFQGISYLIESLFQSNLKMEYSSIALIISKCFFALSIFLIILNKGTLMNIFLVSILSEAFRTLIDYMYSKKFIKINIDFNLGTLKYLIKQALPFVIGYGLFIIYYRIDVLMLSIYQGDIPVGIYSAAYKLTDPLLFLPGALASTLMPVMSKQYFSDKEKLKNTYLMSMRYILALMLPIVFGIYLLSKDIINFLYSSEFSGSIIALQMLSGTIIFNSLNSIQSSLLTSVNRQELNTLTIGICCILNIGLNVVFIPDYSYMGAAFATLVSVIALFFIEFYFIYVNLSLHFVNVDLLKLFIASGVMGLTLIKFPSLNMFTLAFIGGIIYIVSIFSLNVFSKDDIQLLLKVLNHR